MNRFLKAPRRSRGLLALSLPIFFLAIGCASLPPPTENLQAAQQAIANAERVDAATNAAVELGDARAKLTSANAAMGDKQMLIAQRLADESRAAAELAAARSTVAKANAVNADMKRSTATLVEEMQRKTGDSK
ncbi:MAG: DUF4398 domain-containing protein [Pseudomonadota bacterium]